MTPDVLRTLFGWVEVLRPALTAPGFRNAVVVLVGWVLTSGPHAVTQALVMTEVAGVAHHERFHRFFSRGSWNPDRLGQLLFERIVAMLPPGSAIYLVIDDTLATKKGPEVFGIGCHIDPVRSTRGIRIFCFGHVWVVLAVVIEVPFSRRPWALPVLFRLYRSKKECTAHEGDYRKKTELAREMVEVVAGWAPDRRLEVTADSAYCNDTVLRDLSERIVWFGAMRPDAVLTALPPKRRRGRPGRPRMRGRVLPKPEALARSSRRPWLECKVEMYGAPRRVFYKTIDAQWYRACGARLLRIVVVRVEGGAVPWRVFFCTDSTVEVADILHRYSGRWSVEVTFRDLKQLLGFGDSQARKKQAVERTAPFVGYIFDILVLWFVDDVWRTNVATPPLRPWYRHKRGLCFADVLRAAQRTFVHLEVLDPARSLDNLQNSPAAAPPQPSRRVSRRASPDRKGET